MASSMRAALVAALCAAALIATTSARNTGDYSRSPYGQCALDLEYLSYPVNAFDKLYPRSTQVAVQTDKRGESEQIKTGYHVLIRSGEQYPKVDSSEPDDGSRGVFGLGRDATGAIITLTDGTGAQIYNDQDFTSLLKVEGKLYTVTHFEAPKPSVMYGTEVEQNADTGIITVKWAESVDMSAWGGLWDSCAGSVTPWHTHLGSEEGNIDARFFETVVDGSDVSTVFPSSGGSNGDIGDFVRYYGLYRPLTIGQVKDVFNPYNYNFVHETSVSGGKFSFQKHYALGRISSEVPYVMPDQRTVYVTDDNTNGIMLLFIADVAGKLDAGTLYALKLKQLSPDGADGGDFTATWVSLGHATQKYLEDNKPARFSELFETATPNAAAPFCPHGFKSVNGGFGLECLKVKDGKEVLASRFETRRYASYHGATTEFTKLEGLTHSRRHRALYTAVTEVRQSMENNMDRGTPSTRFDAGISNDIRLKWNACGAVYRMNLGRSNKINSDYVAKTLTAVVVGKPIVYSPFSVYAENNAGSGFACDVSSISSPDNVSFMDEYNQLVIDEDTDTHFNAYTWVWSPESGKLTRILTAPEGAEWTGAYWHSNINNWAYLFNTVQHPGPEAAGENFEKGYVGYVGPFPTCD